MKYNNGNRIVKFAALSFCLALTWQCVGTVSGSESRSGDLSQLITGFAASQSAPNHPWATMLRGVSVTPEAPPTQGIPGTPGIGLNGLIAYKAARIRRNARVNGDVFALGDCTGVDCPGNPKRKSFEIIVGHKALIADGFTLKADAVKIRRAARVEGVIEANTIEQSRRAEVGETKTPLGSVPVLPAFMKGSPGQESPAKGTTSLTPGEYGVLKVRRNTSLVLNGGFYHFEAIRMHRGSSLLCAGSCTLLVKSHVRSGRNTTIRSESQKPGDVVFFVEGPESNDWRPRTARVGRNSRTIAHFYLKRGALKIGREARFTGTGMAPYIFVGRDSEYTAAPFSPTGNIFTGLVDNECKPSPCVAPAQETTERYTVPATETQVMNEIQTAVNAKTPEQKEADFKLYTDVFNGKVANLDPDTAAQSMVKQLVDAPLALPTLRRYELARLLTSILTRIASLEQYRARNAGADPILENFINTELTALYQYRRYVLDEQANRSSFAQRNEP